MTVINKAQTPLLLDLVNGGAAPGVGPELDVQYASTITGVVVFSAADVANNVRVEGRIDGVWGIVADVLPGAALPSGAFSFAGPYDALRAEVVALGAAVTVDVRAHGV